MITRHCIITRCIMSIKAFIVIILPMLVLVGCTSCTKVTKTSISGSIVLINDTEDPANDPVDFAGVTVSLYQLAILDTAITRINQEYPQIGVPISQETEFDYRLATPVASATTHADGKFSLDDIQQGRYNIVISKDGWGPVVRYDVSVNDKSEVSLSGNGICDYKGTSSKGEISTVTLYPEVSLPQLVTGNWTFKPDHSYIVNFDTNILGSCVFEGRAQLLLSQGVNLNINGVAEFDSTAGYSWVRSKTIGSNLTEIPRWNSVKFYANDISISNLVVSNANTGIVMYGENSTLKNSRIFCATNGVYLAENYSSLENCVFSQIDSRAAIYDQSEGSSVIKHWVLRSIFYQCTEGIRTLGQPIAIMDNYFLENVEALISFRGYHKIQNNEFDRNESGIVINGNIYNLDYNRFYSNENSIIFSVTYHTSISNPRIKDNDFYQTSGFAIKLWPRTINTDINATNNYWKGENIDALVVDVVDIPLVVYHLIYLPKRTSPVPTAGIRG